MSYASDWDRWAKQAKRSDLRTQLREDIAEALEARCSVVVAEDGQWCYPQSEIESTVLEALAPLLAVVEGADELLSSYLPDPCWHDHHGYCQEHGLGERPCCVERIRQALANLHPRESQ